MQGLDIAIYFMVHIFMIISSILIAKSKTLLRVVIIGFIVGILFFIAGYVFEEMKNSGIILNKNADIFFHYKIFGVYIIGFTIYLKRKRKSRRKKFI